MLHAEIKKGNHIPDLVFIDNSKKYKRDDKIVFHKVIEIKRNFLVDEEDINKDFESLEQFGGYYLIVCEYDPVSKKGRKTKEKKRFDYITKKIY